MSAGLDSLLGNELENLGRILNPVESAGERLREGENRFVCILFMDLKGFTALGERLHSEDVQQILDRVLTVFTNSIEKYGGYIDKYEGDLIMALFGSRNAGEKDTEHALLAGLKMLRDLPEVNRLLGTELKIRIGVNSGVVTTGRVGKKREGDFTVYGDAVNVASRMESNAPDNSILITAGTRALVQERFEVEDRGRIALKGKSEPVQVYRVLREARLPGLRTARSASAPLLGREAALEQLKQRWHTAGERPLRITLKGEAGCGKSRLAREFLAGLELPARRVCAASPATGLERGRELWRSLLLPLLQLDESLEGDALGSALEVALREALPQAEPRVRTTFRLLLGLTPEQGQATPQSAERLEEWITLGLRQLLEACAAREPGHPLVLLLEDMQQADASTRGILDKVCNSFSTDVTQGRLVLLQLERGGEAKEGEILLEPLDDASCRQLLAHLLETERPPRGLQELLLPRSGGNPWLLMEHVAWLKQRGLLSKARGRWRLEVRPEEEVLPQGVQQLLLSRIDLLPPATKLSLQMAAVLASPLPRELLANCLGRLDAVEAPQEEIDSLLAEGWLARGEGDGLVFSSSLSAEAGLACLLRHNRRLLHGIAAEEARDLHEAEVDWTAWIALQYHAAERPEEAREWLERAWTLCDGATPTAKRLELLDARLERERDPTLRAELLHERGRLLEGRGDWRQALEMLARAEEALPAERHPELQLTRARLLALTGEGDRALTLLAEARREARTLAQPLVVAASLAEEARLLRLRGRLPEAATGYGEALDLLEETESPQARADCLAGLGRVESRLGRAEVAARHLAEGLQLYRQLGDLRGEATCMHNLGDQHMREGRTQEAAACYREAIQHCRDLGFREGEAASRRSSGDAAMRQQDFEQAGREYAQSLELFEELDDRHGRAVVLRSMGRLALLQGRLEDAEKHLLTSRELRTLLKDKRGETLALLDLAQLERRRRRLPQALAYVQGAEAGLRDLREPLPLIGCLRTHGEILAEIGEGEQALRPLREAVTLAEEKQNLQMLAECCLTLVRLSNGKEPDKALRQEAANWFRDTGREEQARACEGSASS